MKNSLIGKSLAFLFICPLLVSSALSKDLDNQMLSKKLETLLNEKKHNLLKDLFLQKPFKEFEKKYLKFNKHYKDTKWSIKTISNDPSKMLLDVKITSRREISNQLYNLNSKLTIKIETFQDKIRNYQVVNEESILNSQKSPIIVRIISPDKVQTGEKYEMNLIIEKPLDHSLFASGMIVLENNQNINISNHPFGIQPNQSGGLFKYIQAPLEPGFQTISAIITHPGGIYSMTKKIKVGL